VYWAWKTRTSLRYNADRPAVRACTRRHRPPLSVRAASLFARPRAAAASQHFSVGARQNFGSHHLQSAENV
jgi:hypothetical protein